MGIVIAALVMFFSFGVGVWVSDDGNPILIGFYGVLMFGLGLVIGAVLQSQ